MIMIVQGKDIQIQNLKNAFGNVVKKYRTKLPGMSCVNTKCTIRLV